MEGDGCSYNKALKGLVLWGDDIIINVLEVAESASCFLARYATILFFNLWFAWGSLNESDDICNSEFAA